jgi:predicted outer membrane repeat protein
MRYLFGFLCVCALGLVLMAGCSDETGFPCTEQGIRDAIAEGGGPQTFDCGGPTTVVTEAEIVIDNDVILDGESNLTVEGDEGHRVFAVPEGVVAELRGFLVTGGTSGFQHDGGGINNNGTLTLTDSAVSGNTARGSYAYGGGIGSYGTLTLINSTVSGNTAGHGGGIWSKGTLTLTDSTVSGNTATGTYSQGGGGIWHEGTLTLTNSTVSGNTGDYGGGIVNGGTLTLIHSTVSGNTAKFPGGGIYNGGTAMLTNSTVSGNTADFGGGIYNAGTLTLTSTLVDGDCELSANPPSSITSNGYNIESPGNTCGFDPDGTDQVGVTEGELNLGPLQDNGGPTMTHALGDGSVAIDVIPADMCEVDEDQRGEPRPETDGTMCDVGAFEVQR